MNNKAVSLDDNGLITNIIVIGTTIPEGYQSIGVTPIMGLSINDCTNITEQETVIKMGEDSLSNTDWIVTKINEVFIGGGDIDSLVAHYSDTLDNRATARVSINEAEVNIQNIRAAYPKENN